MIRFDQRPTFRCFTAPETMREPVPQPHDVDQVKALQPWIRKRLPYFLLAVCSVLYFAPFLRVFTYNGDEGTLVTGASRVLDGEVPLRDFFEVMGPGTFYWVAVFFKLFGATWLATRICLLLTTSTIAVLIYYLARHLGCRLPAVPVIFFVAVSGQRWTRISHHMDSNLLALLSFAAFVHWIDNRRQLMLFFAGLGAGLTTWFMLPKGLLLIISFVGILWIRERKITFGAPVRNLLGGYLTVVVSVILLYWLAAGLPDLIYANLLWPLTNYGPNNAVPYGSELRELYWIFRTSFQTLCPPLMTVAISSFLCLPFVIAIGLPLVLVAFGGRQLWLARLQRPAASVACSGALPYWIAGCALWLSEIHRKDVGHIVFGSPILIILAFYYYGQLRSRWAGQTLQLIAINAAVLAALNPLSALTVSNKVVTRRGAVYGGQDHSVLDVLNARVKFGEPIFVYPYSAMYYFISGAKNPTRYSLLMYQMNTDAQFRDVLNSLETGRIQYVVWDRSFPRRNWFPTYRMPPPDKQIIEPYLNEHYRVIAETTAGYQVLERKDQR